jgi:flavin reductase (DIM6/NTAB) family NADH-FMN oxidoreductase RutF
MHCDPDQFRAAMRRFPASVCIVTTGASPSRNGLTATAVCSLSASPPQILACLNLETGTCRAIQANQRFAVNVLKPSHISIARRFAGMDGAVGEQRFLQGCWRDGQSGSPILADALLVLECSLSTFHAVNTHTILIGEVLNIPNKDGEEALLYRNGSFGSWAPVHEEAG